MSRSATTIAHDEASHRHVMVNFCGVANDTYASSLLYLALQERGVTDTFHYSNLCKADIEALDAPPAAGSTERRPVPFAQKQLFLAAIQCHVHLSRQKGKVMNWQRILPRGPIRTTASRNGIVQLRSNHGVVRVSLYRI